MKSPSLLVASIVMALCGTAWADAFSYTATDLPQPLPLIGGTLSTIIVPAGGGIDGLNIDDLNILINIDHPRVQDLVVHLRHDDTGTTVLLADQRGGTSNDYDDVTFDDDASQPIADFVPPGTGQSFRPEEALTAFLGESLVGSWTLIVEDVTFLNPGELVTFTMSGSASAVTTPEPGTYAMFGLGLAGLAAFTARRRRAAAAAAAGPSAS